MGIGGDRGSAEVIVGRGQRPDEYALVDGFE
jgi:hypothetical protein